MYTILSPFRYVHYSSLLILLVCLLQPSLSKAQSFLLPLELYEGGTFIEGVDPFSFSLRLHPTWNLGEQGTVRAGGTVALAYNSPDWGVQGGLRVAFKVGAVELESVPALLFYLGVEGLWESSDFLGNQNRGMIGPNFILDTGSLRLGARAHYDYVNEAWGLGGWIGMDIIELFRLINPPAEPDPFD